MRRWLGVAMLALLTIPVPPAAATPADVVISQVYGGGGNAGAPFAHDFIELFNRGAASVDVGGWSVQYASATSGSWRATALAGSIPPGGSYLVRQSSGGAHGSPLPAADAAGSIALAAGSGKVALASRADPLACGTACAGDGSVADLVGYGAATDFEGSAPAPAGGNALAVTRIPCADTDDNGADFTAEPPAPRSSTDPPAPCSPTDEEEDPCAGDDPPALDVSARPSTLWPPNRRMVEIAITTATDDDAVVELVETTSSEPDQTTVDDPPGDVDIAGNDVRLRAERLGEGPGRAYTLSFEAMDACGNAARASALVRVPHDRRRRA